MGTGISSVVYLCRFLGAAHKPQGISFSKPVGNEEAWLRKKKKHLEILRWVFKNEFEDSVNLAWGRLM